MAEGVGVQGNVAHCCSSKLLWRRTVDSLVLGAPSKIVRTWFTSSAKDLAEAAGSRIYTGVCEELAEDGALAQGHILAKWEAWEEEV